MRPLIPLTGRSITIAWAEFDRKDDYMGTKLDKIGADLKRAKDKRSEWDSKVKDLERRYKEEENVEIHDMVHAANLTPEQLADLIRRASQGTPKPETIQNMEETDYEN